MLSDKLIGFFFSNELFAGYCVKIVRESNNRTTSESETVNVTSIQLWIKLCVIYTASFMIQNCKNTDSGTGF